MLNMELNKVEKILLIILYILVLFGIFSFIYSLVNPEIDAILYISGFSTFMIAILTILYVYTNSNQLYIMKLQLDEMMNDRILQNQPLPWIFQNKITIEKPRLYYYPPGKKHRIFSRYHVNFNLKNVGKFPALCIDMSAKIVIQNKDQELVLNSTSINIEGLEEKQTYPIVEKKDDNTFLFCTDHENLLLEIMREDDIRKYPILMFRILYKNLLGACFLIYHNYLIYPPSSQTKENIDYYAVITNWLTKIKSFPIEYKNDLDKLVKLKNSKDFDSWNSLFEEMNKKLVDSLNIKEENIELDLEPISGTFEVQTISNEKYTEMVKDLQYGIRVIENMECLSSNEKT